MAILVLPIVLAIFATVITVELAYITVVIQGIGPT